MKHPAGITTFPPEPGVFGFRRLRVNLWKSPLLTSGTPVEESGVPLESLWSKQAAGGGVVGPSSWYWGAFRSFDCKNPTRKVPKEAGKGRGGVRWWKDCDEGLYHPPCRLGLEESFPLVQMEHPQGLQVRVYWQLRLSEPCSAPPSGSCGKMTHQWGAGGSRKVPGKELNRKHLTWVTDSP